MDKEEFSVRIGRYTITKISFFEPEKIGAKGLEEGFKRVKVKISSICPR